MLYGLNFSALQRKTTRFGKESREYRRLQAVTLVASNVHIEKDGYCRQTEGMNKP